MAKAKFDIQKVMLEKGEQIGVGIAGGLALLLLMLSLFMPGKGFLSPSPEKNAKELNEAAKYITQQLNDPNNLPKETDLPPKAEGKLLAFEMTALRGEEFRLAPFDSAVAIGSTGRRQPIVLDIEEVDIRLARMQIQTYRFAANTNPPKIMALLRPDGAAGGGGGSAGRLPPSARNALRGASGSRSGGGGGAPPGEGMSGMGGMPGALSEPEGKDRKEIPLSLTDLDKRQDVDLAEDIRPLRMAIIAGSFPFKKQVEEFKNKLGMRSESEVLSDKITTSKNKSGWAFRFVGVDVMRRELDGDGNPLEEWDEKKHRIDLTASYLPLLVSNGSRLEPEDPLLRPVLAHSAGLVMPRLQQFRPDGGAQTATNQPGSGSGEPGVSPPGMNPMGAGKFGGKQPGGGLSDGDAGSADPSKDKYPKIEKELPKIAETLKAFEGKKVETAVIPERFRGATDIFNLDPDNDTSATTGPGMTDAPQGGGGGGAINKPGPMGSGPGIEGASPEQVAEQLPEYCLFRVIDVNVRPGKSYEYRLRIRMANPNYKREDAASPAYKVDEELKTDWSKKTVRVHVDPELRYYAVDQKKLEPRYTGQYADARINEDSQTWLQAHRWMEQVRMSSSGVVNIGEWSVAERFPASRGEYVGRSIRVELPYWRYLRAGFFIASDQKEKGANRNKPSVQVDFGFGAGSVLPEAMMLDLHNGRYSMERVKSRDDEGQPKETAKISDECGSEALILDPNGKLLLLEGGIEAEDKDRQDRLAAVRKRIREVKEGQKAGGGGNEKKPFGNGGGGSGS